MSTPLTPSTSRDHRGAGRRPALGRSLSALLAEEAPNGGRPAYRLLPLDRLRPAPGQPRRHFAPAALAELAQSIAAQGVLQPLVVRRLGEDFEIVAGERRWRAAAQAGLHEVPAVVQDLDDARAMQVALVENLQRQDLAPIEEAQAFRRLIDEHQLSHEAVARAVGKGRAAISHGLRLLQLPPAVQRLVEGGQLSAGHARAVLRLERPEAQVAFAEELARTGASVRQAEARAERRARAPAGPAAERRPSPNQRALEERLQRRLGTRVELVAQRGRGHLRLFFADLEGLEALTERLLGGH